MSQRRQNPPTDNGDATNGDDTNGNGLAVAPFGDGQRQLSPKELSHAFGHVPWMEFNVTARPNIKAFASHPAVRQVISDVAQGTLDDVKQAITDNVNKSINDIVAKAVQDATGDVPSHVMRNMAKTFNNLSLAPTVTPFTGFQPLQSAGIINNFNNDNSTNFSGNTINNDSNNTNNNSNNTDSGNNNNNPVIFPPTPGPDPNPLPGPTPGPTPGPDPSPAISNPDITKAQWIWTNEQPFISPPPGPRAFRKAVQLGQSVDSMVIDITCDNFYTVYFNGTVIGNGIAWNVVQRFAIKFPRTNKVLIAVYAAQDPISMQEAGLLASAVLWDSTSSSARPFDINTDSSWKVTTSAPSNFERISFRPDSSWTAARIEGPYGMGPWGAVPKPTATDSLNGPFTGVNGIPDAPSAPSAIAGPDASGTTTV